MMKQREFEIGRKLANRMLRIYLFIILLVLSIMSVTVVPAFLRISKNNAESTVQMIQDQYEAAQEKVADLVYTTIALKELSDLLYQYESNPSKENVSKINLYLGTIQSSSSLLYIMVERIPSGVVFKSIRYSDTDISSYVGNSPYYRELYNYNTSYYAPFSVDDRYFATDNNSAIPFGYYSLRQTYKGIDYVITACYNVSNLLKTTEFATNNGLDGYLVFNRQGECVYATDAAMIAPAREAVAVLTSSQRQGTTYYFIHNVTANGNIIVGVASLSTMLSSLLFLLCILLLLVVIPPLLFYLFMIPANNRFLYPLKKLSSEMSAFSIGGPSPEVISTGDEIEELSRVFTQMVDKINEQTTALVKGEQEKAITVYKLLTTQLEPHFVYNTMNIINILARQGQTDDVIAINNALRRILRERLNSEQNVFDEVSREVETLQQYVLIMNYRYKNAVNFDYDVDPDLQQELIVKNILQPLVENAFYHGLTDSQGEVAGNISIMVYSQANQIIVEVSDDGKGFQPDKLKWMQEHSFNVNRKHQKGDSHIGLANIHARLRHVYANEFLMEVHSQPGFGSTIILTLPKIS